MSILQLYSNDNFIVINRDFAKSHGVNNAIIFGNLCSMASQTGNSFYFTIEKLAEKSLLCTDTIKKGLKYLSDNGYITKVRKGVPAQNIFSINEEKLEADLSSNKMVENNTNWMVENNTNYIKNNNTNNKNTLDTFKKPSVQEVDSYCQEHAYSLDAQRFIDYYESNGWKVGKNKMKDWRAAVRNWWRNNNSFSKGGADVVLGNFLDIPNGGMV